MKDHKIVTLRQPGEFADPATEMLRNGARQLLSAAQTFIEWCPSVPHGSSHSTEFLVKRECSLMRRGLFSNVKSEH